MASKGGDRIMELKNRSQYLDKLISVQDMEVIKVVTGIRRCGKSSLLKLMMAHLREQGGMEEQILSMNFESMQFADMDSKSLYQYVMERASKGKRLYLFLDEVQKVRDWQDAVNSFRVDLDCDIYVTGSNAYLLSSELSTYLSGRYNAATLEFPPLSRIPPFRVHATLQRRYGVRCEKRPRPDHVWLHPFPALKVTAKDFAEQFFCAHSHRSGCSCTIRSASAFLLTRIFMG